MFTGEIVERLAAIQVLQQGSKGPSIKAALELVREGDASEVLERLEQLSFEEALCWRLERLTKAVEGLQEHNRVLQEQLRALEAPTDEKGAADTDPEILAELEEQRRINACLKGEIVRREMEATQQAKRPWWRLFID